MRAADPTTQEQRLRDGDRTDMSVLTFIDAILSVTPPLMLFHIVLIALSEAINNLP